MNYIVPTKRRSMTKHRAAKIFLREQGRCYLCGMKLTAGVHPYHVEHPDALALGGADNDDDLKIVCVPCHRDKTNHDRQKISKRDRVVTSTWQGRKKKKIPYRRFNGEAVWPE